MRGGPQTPELSSGGQTPCSIGFSPGEYSWNPCVSVPQLVLLWEAAFTFAEFWGKTLWMCLPMLWWVIYDHTCPHHSVFHSFWPKQHDPHAPPSLFTPSHPQVTLFCFPGCKQSSKRNILLMWKRWNKNSGSIKKHQNWQIQKVLWAVEKCLNWSLHKGNISPSMVDWYLLLICANFAFSRSGSVLFWSHFSPREVIYACTFSWNVLSIGTPPSHDS